ncbi:hypothetical protein N0V88_005110 [Collariella sp. IMI 366227]|nr:hypothetical protein N0V88_005110 [Collariella sp. IMI 366227]
MPSHSPPLPFPLPLRIGTDICRISRIYDILHTTRRTRFVRRVLAPEELPYVKQKVRTLLGEDVNDEEPVMSGPTMLLPLLVLPPALPRWRRWLRAKTTWAAKEAVFKAHPHLRLGFHDVLILTPGQLAQVVPELAEEDMYRRRNLAAPLALIRAGGRRRSQMAEVSISHDIGYATATCIGFEAAPESEGMGWDPSES